MMRDEKRTLYVLIFLFSCTIEKQFDIKYCFKIIEFKLLI